MSTKDIFVEFPHFYSSFLHNYMQTKTSCEDIYGATKDSLGCQAI